METIESLLTRDPVIEIGEVSIRPIDEFSVWLEHESGEGMAVDKEVLAQVLVKFLEENL